MTEQKHAAKRMPRKVIHESSTIMKDVIVGTGVWALTVLAFLAPFLGWPGGTPVFFEPLFDTTLRRLVLFLVTGLLLALMTLSWARARRISWRPHWLDLPVLLFLLGLLVSAFRSPYPQLAFFGPLWNQIALPYVGTSLALYVVVRYFLRTPAECMRVAAAMALAGGLVALIGLLDWAGGHGYAATFTPPRLTSILRNPMFTGLYLAMLVPLAGGLTLAVTTRWQRWMFGGCAVVMTLALLLTLARSAWLGFAAALLLCGLACAWRFRGVASRPMQLAILGAGVALLVVVLVMPGVRARLRSMTNLRDATVQSRLVYMQSAWQMFRARLLTGWGVGTFTLVAPEFRPATNVEEGGVSINRVAALALPHNLPLQIAAETGLVGLIPFLTLLLLALCAGAFLRDASPWQWGMTWGLVGLTAAYLVTTLFSFDISITLANCWLGLGLLAAVTSKEPSSTSKPAFGMPVAIPLYVLACLIGLGTLGWVIGDGSAASDTLLGTRQCFHDARAWAKRDPVRCRQSSEAGLALLQQAIKDAPVPSFVSRRYLAMAYREQMLLLRETQPAVSTRAREAFFREGRQALRMMDRDPEMQLFLAIEYLDCGRFEDARMLLKQVLYYLPNSAQAHLLQAKLFKSLPLAASRLSRTLLFRRSSPGGYRASDAGSLTHRSSP